MKKRKRVQQESDSEQELFSNSELISDRSDNPDSIQSSQQGSSIKSSARRRLNLGGYTPPKRSPKAESAIDNVVAEAEGISNLVDTEKSVSIKIKFSCLYAGNNHYFPGQSFDVRLLKFKWFKKEKTV